MPDDQPAARYVFGVRFRLDPGGPDVRVDPRVFETTLYREADPPGEDGWRFFRDNLWRGELNDPDHFRALTAERLGTPVDDVTFRELRTTEAYLGRFREAVGDDLASFKADTVDEAIGKYLGSSIHVVEPGEV